MVAVVGPGRCTEVEASFAERLGAVVALNGVAIVTGGRGGVMEAACRGASDAGGTTVGILPGSDRTAANPFVRIVIPTGMGELRNGLVVAAGEMVVAIGGGYGTLSEIALALKTGKTVIGWHTWDADRNSRLRGAIISVASVEEAWDLMRTILSLKE